MYDKATMRDQLTTIEVEFGTADLDATYQCISAIVDLALTRAGADLARLERADVALIELVERIATTGGIRAASLAVENGASVLRVSVREFVAALHTDLPDGSDDLIEAGLGTWRVDGHDVVFELEAGGRR